MGACASKPKVLGDKLRDKPRHAPSHLASKSNGVVPPSLSTEKVTSMNEDKHISSDSAIFNKKLMHSSAEVEDGKKHGDMREVIMTQNEDDDDGKKYVDKDDDKQDGGNDEGGEEDENDQEMTVTSEENDEDDENGDEFEDEQVTTMTQKDGHDDDEEEVRDEDESEDNNCDKKETILNRSMNEYVGEDEIKEEEKEKDKHEIIVKQKDDEIKEKDVGERQVVLMQRENKYEEVDLKSSICDRKNQMDDISPRKIHDSPSSKNRDTDHVNHDHSVNINLHSKDVVDPVEEDQNIFIEEGDVNKLELHGTTPTKQRGNEDSKIRSTSSNEEVEETSSNEEVEEESINPIKSPLPTYNNKSVVIEATNPTGLQTLFSSSPAKPTKDVVVLDQHPILHPTMVLKNQPPSLIKKDVAAKGAEVKPKENSTNRCTNTAISSTIAF